ncbi:unnamed protein product, partial [Symbiodinium necroappetens]
VLPVAEETPAVALSPERLDCTPPANVCPKLHGVTQPAKAPVPQPALPSAADVNCEVFTDAFQGANKRSSPGPLEERPAQQPKGKGLAAAVGTMEIGVFEPPGFVLHLGAGTRGIIRTLVAASAEYATLKDRLAKMEETPDLLAHVRKLGWHHPTDSQWLHLRWSQEREQLIPEEPQRMFPHAALSGHLDSILEILEEDKVLHQFNATRRFNDQTDSTVMFFIRVSLQGQKAQLLFQRLLALCGLGCLQMIDATLRRERLEPQPLAKQLRNLSDRRNRQGMETSQPRSSGQLISNLDAGDNMM